LTPSQARGLLTRVRIRAPFDGEIISLEVKSFDTIDNVKTIIDSVKAKIQDEED
jgi:multidrug resistance efflux pump